MRAESGACVYWGREYEGLARERAREREGAAGTGEELTFETKYNGIYTHLLRRLYQSYHPLLHSRAHVSMLLPIASSLLRKPL